VHGAVVIAATQTQVGNARRRTGDVPPRRPDGDADGRCTLVGMQDYDWFVELLMDEGLTLEEAKAMAAATVKTVASPSSDGESGTPGANNDD